MAQSTVAPNEWPEFTGVDSSGIREQIRGDARLFVRLLRKLIDDHAELRSVAAAADAVTIHGLASLAHKLKGGAGTLGVTRVFELARDAERAAAAGDVAGFARNLERAAGELDALRGEVYEAAARIASHRRVGSEDDHAAVDLEEFAQLLRQQSLASLRRFDAIEPSLRHLIGDDAAQSLHGLLDQLRFDAAADLIDRFRQRPG